MEVSAERANQALGFLRLSYKDYIAARVLLNKGYIMQGVALASTAIEKLFKAGICIRTGKVVPVHLDQFDKIKKVVEEMGYGELFNKIDPLFLQILGKAYTLRYYDKIKVPVTIGFFRNQFIGELDGAVALFDKLFILGRADGQGTILTPLQQDVQKGNPDLFENNWIAQKISKEQFMGTDCEGFAIHILPTNVYEEIIITSKKMNLGYDGRMQYIKVGNTPPVTSSV